MGSFKISQLLQFVEVKNKHFWDLGTGLVAAFIIRPKLGKDQSRREIRYLINNNNNNTKMSGEYQVLPSAEQPRSRAAERNT